jgi:tetratricopeptide (TPR) repeat protein
MMARVAALERTRREPYLYRFLSNMELGNGPAADEDLDAALRFYPDLFEANLALVRVHILNERYGSAEQAVDKAQTLATTDEQKALIYYWAGITYEKRENSKKAAEYWQLLLDLPEKSMTAKMRTEATTKLSNIVTPTDSAKPTITKPTTPTKPVTVTITPTSAAPITGTVTKTPTTTPTPSRTPSPTPTK